jgi:hypothetical protein
MPGVLTDARPPIRAEAAVFSALSIGAAKLLPVLWLSDEFFIYRMLNVKLRSNPTSQITRKTISFQNNFSGFDDFWIWRYSDS